MLHDDDDDYWPLKVVAAHIALELLPNLLVPTMAVGAHALWTPCRTGTNQSIGKRDVDICKDSDANPPKKYSLQIGRPGGRLQRVFFMGRVNTSIGQAFLAGNFLGPGFAGPLGSECRNLEVSFPSSLVSYGMLTRDA
jgi:hypothetical protein